MKCSSVMEWKIGDKGITEKGEIVTISRKYSNMLEIEEPLIKKLYIPSHGQIEKYQEIEKVIIAQKIAIKGAIAALSQNAVYPADITAAKKWLEEVIR